MKRRDRPARKGAEQWQRNQWALSFSVLVWFVGSSFVTPFLPLFIQQLGSLSAEETALWSGISLGAAPLISGMTTPLWGALADRAGRKPMMQRSLIAFTACLALMGFATEPWHILAIRAAMGTCGGFVVAALALVTVGNPPDRVNDGIGQVTAARVLGLAIGPLIGGVLADVLGYRNSFFASVGVGVIAIAMVTLLISEKVYHRDSAGVPAGKSRSWRELVVAPAFLGVLLALALTRLSERTFDPILPLYVATLGESGFGLATTTGIIASGGLAAATVASATISRITRNRSSTKALVVALSLAALAFLPLAVAGTWWELLIFRAAVGLLLGAATTLAFSVGASITPQERRGLALGILGSGGTYGASLGFLMAGVVASFDLALVFVVNGALLAVATPLCAWAFRREARKTSTPAPAVIEHTRPDFD